MRIGSMLLAIPVAFALSGAASAAPVSSASSLAIPESGMVEVKKGGHGHHHGWGRGRGHHYGWNRGRHRGSYKHNRHRRHWY